MTVRYYEKQFAGQIKTIFENKMAFLPAFGGEIQVKDVIDSDVFITVKLSDKNVVINDYSTDADVGMGTDTSSRFGPAREIKSVNKEIKLDSPKSIHEKIDKMTVNDEFDEVVAERLAIGASTWADYYDKELGKYLADNKGKELEGDATLEGITKMFDEAYAEMVNNNVSMSVTKTAYVTPKAYALIMNSPLTVSTKGSSVNIDDNNIIKFKEFNIELVPAPKMASDIIFAANSVGVAGLGLETARVITVDTSHAGYTIQGASKLGKYIPEEYKKAIITGKLKDVVEG